MEGQPGSLQHQLAVWLVACGTGCPVMYSSLMQGKPVFLLYYCNGCFYCVDAVTNYRFNNSFRWISGIWIHYVSCGHEVVIVLIGIFYYVLELFAWWNKFRTIMFFVWLCTLKVWLFILSLFVCLWCGWDWHSWKILYFCYRVLDVDC